MVHEAVSLGGIPMAEGIRQQQNQEPWLQGERVLHESCGRKTAIRVACRRVETYKRCPLTSSLETSKKLLRTKLDRLCDGAMTSYAHQPRPQSWCSAGPRPLDLHRHIHIPIAGL